MFNTESQEVLLRECSPDSVVQFLKHTHFFDKQCYSTVVHFFVEGLVNAVAVQTLTVIVVLVVSESHVCFLTIQIIFLTMPKF